MYMCVNLHDEYVRMRATKESNKFVVAFSTLTIHCQNQRICFFIVQLANL